MRTKHTLLNISAGLANQLIITLLGFVSRTVFIHSLGIDYLGVNALFTSVLAMLSLAEAGIGSSIVFNLYKPVAEKNRLQILALMKLYRNTYRIIALVVTALGLAVLPFLDLIVKGADVPHIELVYLIFLVNTAVPYLFVYKHSYLNVNQKNYIVTAVFSISSIISTVIRIAILYYTENYLLYLAVDTVITIATSIILTVIVNRKYPYLKFGKADTLDPETKRNFLRNMKAIFIQNVGSYFIFGVESILISTFISIAAVGLYANYKMLIDISRTFVNQIFSNMYHSVGNLVAKESADKIYEVYKATMLLNFWLYSMLGIGMFLLLGPFIRLWLGDSFLLSGAVVPVLVAAFYERGMRNSITTVKTTAGIFHEDRYAPLLQAAINLGACLLLVRELGLGGIFLGGLLSAIAVPFWTTPYLVYKKVFGKPLLHYFLTYFAYTGAGLLALIVAYTVCQLWAADTIAALLLQIAACLIIVNSLYVALFHRTEPFRYLRGVAVMLLIKLHRSGRGLIGRKRELQTNADHRN
ncbi:hypothetical protein B1748_04660 [Paenibacillus sp. MY03]|uniref:lipopolysaccharide biosynthesis protein n=1 Tax=Paenibacillus sp. MY03 TaxID=302980 RepID=UPI000B3CBDED|nr:oligosaccharide flippase family protein [Paenibacillus sp. MY03]OUS78064.1 hypothetical protein B1748_04660 [Paenibacillus sp. MY03]